MRIDDPDLVGWVSMLRCRDGSYDVGSTRNLDARLAQHQRGEGAQCTKHRLPVELVWCQSFERVADAFALEKRIQGWSRAKREAFVTGDFAEISRLAHVRGSRQQPQ